MPSSPSETFDPTRPTLLIRYGTTGPRFRALDTDLFVLGKNRTCHLPLAGADIADIHCLLVRGTTGWRLRDCGSRIGTRVNGEAVRETALHDTDTIQVGPFLFDIHLPGQSTPEERIDPAEVQKLKRSRRRLGRLALRLRQKLREAPAATPAPPAATHPLESLLRERLRECEQRVERLQREERELARERAALTQEMDAFEARCRQAEQEATRRQSESLAELRERLWQAERQLAERPTSGVSVEDLDFMRQEIRARDDLIEQLRRDLKQRQSALAATDLEGYEAELNEFRQQLQKERTTLDEETQMVQERATELDEMMRAMELELSQERAKLARERIELNRLREEIRMEQERSKRPASPLDRLGAIQRTKGEMVER